MQMGAAAAGRIFVLIIVLICSRCCSKVDNEQDAKIPISIRAIYFISRCIQIQYMALILLVF